MALERSDEGAAPPIDRQHPCCCGDDCRAGGRLCSGRSGVAARGSALSSSTAAPSTAAPSLASPPSSLSSRGTPAAGPSDPASLRDGPAAGDGAVAVDVRVGGAPPFASAPSSSPPRSGPTVWSLFSVGDDGDGVGDGAGVGGDRHSCGCRDADRAGGRADGRGCGRADGRGGGDDGVAGRDGGPGRGGGCDGDGNRECDRDHDRVRTGDVRPGGGELPPPLSRTPTHRGMTARSLFAPSPLPASTPAVAVPPSASDAPAAPSVDINENYEPVRLVNSFPPVPEPAEAHIRRVLRERLGFPNPRPCQITAIFHLACRKPGLMYLIHKTGEGKSLVMLGLATMLREVTIVMGPLHGLGTDQANKSKQLSKGIEAWHVDEFRDDEQSELIARLGNVRPNDTLLLFISPQARTKILPCTTNQSGEVLSYASS